MNKRTKKETATAPTIAASDSKNPVDQNKAVESARNMPRASPDDKSGGVSPVFGIFPGFIRGTLPTPILRELLSGNRSLRSALEAGGNRTEYRIHFSKLPAETTVGFIPFPEHPREIIAARLPFASAVVPTVALRACEPDWVVSPQWVSIEQLVRCEGVVMKADWIDYNINLAARLSNATTRAVGIDPELLGIGAAWDRWGREDMTWPARCKDLARISNQPELASNTLEIKCRRLGLLRSDNKAR